MSCCAVFCPSRTTKGGVKDPDISFHTFPKCPEIRKQWIKAVRRENWEPTKYSRLCSKHFEKSSFMTGLSIIKLKTNAVPVIFKEYPKYYQPSVAIKRKHRGQQNENLELTPRKRKRIEAYAEDLPRRALKVGVSAKSQPQKKKKQEEQYDPFREYANDSTDEESPDIKQETTDEAENSDNDESEKGVSGTEKVFLKSVVYKEKQSEDGQTPSKRARLETSDVSLDYSEQLYEFGKYVAEQLLCLDYEEARIAQAEITAVLSEFNTNKITRKAVMSTSNVQPATKPCASGSGVTRKPKGKPVASSVTQRVLKGTASKKKTAKTSVNQPMVSHANTAGPSVTKKGRQVKSEGLMHRSSLTEFAVLNVPGTSSMTPCGYVIVPTLPATTDSGLVTQTGPGTFITMSQPGSSQAISAGISMTQTESSSSFSGTVVKIEPDESESSHTNVHEPVIMPDVTDAESLVIKYEPESEDET